MMKPVLFGALAVASLAAGLASAQTTLEQVQDRGVVSCGANDSLPGFAARTANGDWAGFDVALCQAVAAAVLGDPGAVAFATMTPDAGLAALDEGEIDVLVRVTWSVTNDASRNLDFVGINYFDGTGFMVRADLGIAAATELEGATVCVTSGSATEPHLDDFFRTNNITYVAVPVDDSREGQEQYIAGNCEVLGGAISRLAATRATFETSSEHVILPEILSKEPLGAAVRHGDDEWADIVRWTLNALIAAEEYGVTSVNVMDLAEEPTANREINRLLGTEGSLGAMLGLPDDWAVHAISAVGNYGEVFEGNIGESTPVGLARGLNAQWTNGGLLFSPPFR